MKKGDLKGAFVLSAPLTGDPVVHQSMTRMTFAGIGVLVLVLIGFAGFSRYYIDKPLTKAIGTIHAAVDETSSASAEIANSSSHLADGAAQQAAALEQTSASLEQMSGTSDKNARSLHHVAALTNDARAAAETGAEDIHLMSQAMDEIQTASDNIAKIVHSIDEIAFQTNILALNAAVEAARAGEAGAGFAVVADEVRNLAKRSADAARETAALIESSTARSQRGVSISNRVAESLQQIARKVSTVDDLLKEVTGASQKQKQGVQQINLAMGDIDRITQSNAAAAEETASAATEMHAQMDALMESVALLERLTGARQVAEKASATAPVHQPSLAG
ncbi:MAG: methyl-accepting chemotaxis protein [Puniceicoccaceae bacterium 5H]|nr:MAG: methyl-accepting chemotaxis protein [Puniceicoccaceae bacterium 5H]